MKKIVICALLLCLILTACGQVVQGDPNSGTTATTTPTPQPSMQHTSTTSSTPTIQPPPVPTQPPSASTTYPGIREPVTTTSSPYIEVTDMDTYNSYLQAGVFPDWFITLDQLPEMGEMTLVRTWTKEQFKHFFWGNYKFLAKRESNYEVTLAVFWDRDPYAEGRDLSDQHTGDLRRIPVAYYDAYIDCGGFTYHYRNGKLSSVSWVYSDYLFELFFEDNKLLPQPEETTSFICDLLHTDTAERAMQTFVASMEAGAVK